MTHAAADYRLASATWRLRCVIPAMQITVSTRGPWTVLSLSGKIDERGTEDLKAALLPRMTGGVVALDFAGVEYITSLGFRTLMQAEREQRAKHGRLLLGNLSDPVERFFETAGLGTVFQITYDLDAVIDGES